MNNHIREGLVNKLREFAKEGDTAAQEHVKEIDAARETWTSGKDKGKYTTTGKNGNPPRYKLRPAWQQKNPTRGDELVTEGRERVELAQANVAAAFDMELGLAKEKAAPPAAEVLKGHTDLSGEEFLTRGYKLAKAKIARREEKNYKKHERLTLW